MLNFQGICLLLLVINAESALNSQVEQIGNEIAASASGVDVPGVSFLIDDLVLTEGVLFAYSAFFRSDQPVRFQVWRPDYDKLQERLFKLVGETKVIPSVINRREDVYIVSKLGTSPCVRVKEGDRLGVYLEKAPGAVAYSFDSTNPMALGYTVSNLSDPVKVGEKVRFDPLTFPYDFNMAAYIHLNLTGYDSEDPYPPCPRMLLIPNYVPPTLPPTAPPTGKPGATGATGPRGYPGYDGRRGENGATGAVGPTGSEGAVGQVGSVGPRGPAGKPGMDGPGGATGATGPQGLKGAAGPPGPAGPAAQIEAESKTFISKTFKSSPVMNLILLAWLAVVTIILIVVIIVLAIVARRRRRRLIQEKLPSAGKDWRPTWQDVLREEEEVFSSQESVISDPSSGSDLTISTVGSDKRLNEYRYRPNSQHLPGFDYDNRRESANPT